MINSVKEQVNNIKTRKKDIITFAAILAVIICLYGFFIKKNPIYYPYFLTLAFVVILISLFYSKILMPLYKIWMSIGIIIGTLVNYIILTILFCVCIIPISLIQKALGKDMLNISIDKTQSSYWVKKPEEDNSKEKIEKQF